MSGLDARNGEVGGKLGVLDGYMSSLIEVRCLSFVRQRKQTEGQEERGWGWGVLQEYTHRVRNLTCPLVALSPDLESESSRPALPTPPTRQ